MYSLGGGSARASAVNYDGEKVVGVITAGSTPEVVISDPDSRVIIKASSDGNIHVIDRSRMHGFFFGAPHQMAVPRITRTALGVRIDRASSQSGFTVFGDTTQRLEVDVPMDANVDIQQSSGDEVAGIHGTLRVRSQSGHIALADLQGTVDAQSNDGYIEAKNVTAPEITLNTNSGHLGLYDVQTGKLVATTDDGHVTVQRLQVTGDAASATIHTNDGTVDFGAKLAPTGHYSIGTNDGRINVGIPELHTLAIHARTGDGTIRIDGTRQGSGEGGTSYDSGSELAGSLTLATDSGRITITSMGVN